MARKSNESRALARPSSPKMTDTQKFAAALQEYHAARAANLAVELLPIVRDDDANDKKATAALDRMGAAEWRLAMTPASRPHDIRERAAVVEIMMHDAEHFGEPADGVHFAMLAALRTDLDRLRV